METNKEKNNDINRPKGFIYTGLGNALLFIGGIAIFIAICLAVARLI